MAAVLEALIESQVSIVSNDGRIFVGVLKGFDQSTNLLLNNCSERIYNSTSGVEQLHLGLYLIRGDNIAIVGEVDQDLDSSIELSSIRAAPLKPVVH